MERVCVITSLLEQGWHKVKEQQHKRTRTGLHTFSQWPCSTVAIDGNYSSSRTPARKQITINIYDYQADNLFDHILTAIKTVSFDFTKIPFNGSLSNRCNFSPFSIDMSDLFPLSTPFDWNICVLLWKYAPILKCNRIYLQTLVEGQCFFRRAWLDWNRFTKTDYFNVSADEWKKQGDFRDEFVHCIKKSARNMAE